MPTVMLCVVMAKQYIASEFFYCFVTPSCSVDIV